MNSSFYVLHMILISYDTYISYSNTIRCCDKGPGTINQWRLLGFIPHHSYISLVFYGKLPGVVCRLS